jgi:hypothetical protein
MIYHNRTTGSKKALLTFVVLCMIMAQAFSQDYRLSIRLSPLISWFRTNVSSVSNQGTRAGVDFSVSVEKYFADHFAVTGGLSFINSGGRLKSDVPYLFMLHSSTPEIPAGSPVIYKVQFLSIPIGLKFKSEENNNLSWFAEAGFDPRIVIRGRVDIPVLDLKDQRAMTEIKRFNLGYHITGGISYSLGETTSLSLGLGFANNFLDLTKDVVSQEPDKTVQRFLKFVFGVDFLPSWQ